MRSLQKKRYEGAMAFFRSDPIGAYEAAIERHKAAIKRLRAFIKKLKGAKK